MEEEYKMLDGGCFFCDTAVVLGAIAAYSSGPIAGGAVTIAAVSYFANK